MKTRRIQLRESERLRVALPGGQSLTVTVGSTDAQVAVGGESDPTTTFAVAFNRAKDWKGVADDEAAQAAKGFTGEK